MVRTRDLSDAATVNIPEDAVFEGQGPLWADVDGDGVEDLVSTVSNAEVGAAIYAAAADGTILGQTEPIGQGRKNLPNLLSAVSMNCEASVGGTSWRWPHSAGTSRPVTRSPPSSRLISARTLRDISLGRKQEGLD